MYGYKALARVRGVACTLALTTFFATSLANGVMERQLARASEAIDSILARSPGARQAAAMASSKARRAETAPRQRALARTRTKPEEPGRVGDRQAPLLALGMSDLPNEMIGAAFGGIASVDEGSGATRFGPSPASFGPSLAAPGGGFGRGGGAGTPGISGSEEAGPGPTPDASLTPPPTSAVPEPGSWLLLISGFYLLSTRLRQIRASTAAIEAVRSSPTR